MNKYKSDLDQIKNVNQSMESAGYGSFNVSAKDSIVSLVEIIRGKSFYDAGLTKYLDCDYTVYGDQCCESFTN